MSKFSVVRADHADRPVRVSVPVRVAFAGATFAIREFTANLSVGGIFLPTDKFVEPQTEGQLTFRASQWEQPFTVRAVVVRLVPAGGPGDPPAGLGIQFLAIDPSVRRKLERLVDGIQNGSVVEGIRRSLREDGGTLIDEIRKRPIDQRLMLALQAKSEEIDALLRDGNATVIERLLENPRLNIRHVRAVTKDARLPTRLMIAVRRHESWFSDEEVRFNFCAHRAAPLGDVLRMLATLPLARLQAIGRSGNIRDQVRSRARELVSRRGSGGAP